MDDKRTAILDAALELFAERTFAGTPVPLVAERAGVATGTIYRYFPSKESLANAVYQRAKLAFVHRVGMTDADLAGLAEPSSSALARVPDLGAATPGPDDARAAFAWWWEALCAFADDDPVTFDFLELHHHQPYLDDDSRALSRLVDAAALDVIVRGQAAGALRPGPPAVLLALVLGAFSGVVRARRAAPDLIPPEAPRAAEDLVWDLIRNPGGTPP